MTHRVIAIVALLLVALPARAGEPGGGPAAPLVFGAWRTHVSRALGVALAVPDVQGAPVTVEEQSYPWAQRGVQFEHAITVAGGRLRVEVFTDPDGLPLETWFERHFGFLVDARALVWSTELAKGVPAVVVAQPATPQTFARRTTVLRLGDWTLVTTCEGLDDPDNVKLCDAVVRSLRPVTLEELQP